MVFLPSGETGQWSAMPVPVMSAETPEVWGNMEALWRGI